MFRVLVLLVLVSLGWVAVCGCVGGGAKPLSLQASNLPAGRSAAAVFAAAIRGRRPVAFEYNGVSRVAHPHRMGASAAGNGKTLVRAWEVTRGDAPSGKWKLFDVAKIRDPRLLPGAPFAPAAGYTPRDRAIPAPTAEIEITKATKGTKGGTTE